MGVAFHPGIRLADLCRIPACDSAARGNLTNAQRLATAGDFCRPLLAHVGPLKSLDLGSMINAGNPQPMVGVGRPELPPTKGFVTITPASVQLSALRVKTAAGGRILPDPGTEIRVVEVEGRRSPVTIEFGFPLAVAVRRTCWGRKWPTYLGTSPGSVSPSIPGKSAHSASRRADG